MAIADLHCHLDLMGNGADVAYEAQTAGALIFNNTVTPAQYQLARERCAALDAITTGIGVHPWYAASTPDADLEFAVAEIAHWRFVGEVGLDAGSRHAHSFAAQERAFEAICAACAKAGDRVLSIHAVRTADEALDTLERTGALSNCTCIFHWFSGTSGDLARARKAGCRFSISERMLTSKRGRAYAGSIEPELLLLETDAPANEGEACSFAEQQAELARTLAQLEKIQGSSLADVLQRNAESVLAR